MKKSTKSKMIFWITFAALIQLLVIGFVIYGVIDVVIDMTAVDESENEIVISIGEYVSYEYYDHIHSPRDMESYEKYKYEKVNFDNNEYFRKITDETYNELENFIKDFEGQMGRSHSCDDLELLLDNYTFNVDMVSENDYLYMEYEQYFSSNEFEYTFYHLYFFDSETKVLHEFYRDL